MEQNPSVSDPQPPAMEPPTTSLMARMANVFAMPGEVFEAVKASPPCAANWLVPALILVLVSWVGGGVILSQATIRQQLNEITSKAIEKQIEATKMPKQQADAAREAGEKFGSIGTKVSMVTAPVMVAFLSPFWWGLILWLGLKVWKGDSGFMKAVEVAGLANTIGILEAIVKTLLIVGFGNLFASPSLAMLVKDFDPQNPVHSLLALVNVMTFWLLTVRAIGLAKLAGVSFAKAAAWVFGIWAAYTGLFVGFGLAMRAMMRAISGN